MTSLNLHQKPRLQQKRYKDKRVCTALATTMTSTDSSLFTDKSRKKYNSSRFVRNHKTIKNSKISFNNKINQQINSSLTSTAILKCQLNAKIKENNYKNGSGSSAFLLTPKRILITTFFVLFVFTASVVSDAMPAKFMSLKEREDLREESREMFYHAYRAYLENAYPADELMPLSCKGRYRGVTPSRGDMDDILGNFSMTLVDTLDTLVILGDFAEFESAVKMVIRDVQFDNDIIVSVFETNIRMVGGLLSAHILAEYIQKHADVMLWYRGELLEMARDLGYRLLPAFNTSTGIPHARVNLRTGMKDEILKKSRETCTACAGTILLEFAALSRLTGDPIFEARAHAAMDALWKLRHRGSDLMGTVLNVHSGDWVRRDSGVGAGIDSYYEYLFKSYVLLGDDKYLARFNRHYNAVMKYVSEGPMLLDVLMHRPHAKSRNFMDSLLAFWPGLQVLSGDLKPAVQTHEMLYQVMQMHTFIPEAFTVDFQIHWGQHHLRPEFIESTYFLYRATGDHHYLQVGKKALKTLQKHAKVACGYAAVNDVRTGKHEDRMDSFVLSETFKYLFLLFSEPENLIVNVNEFVFTTEAHLLPLSLAQLGNSTFTFPELDEHNVLDFMRTCPSSNKLFPEQVRRPLRDFITGSCPRTPTGKRLRALDFQANNADHLRAIYDMGITMVSLGDGKAKSPEDGEMGLLFMQEMLELTKLQTMNQLAQLQAVTYKIDDKSNDWTALMAGPSHFSPELTGEQFVEGDLVLAKPFRACHELINLDEIHGKILVAERGVCTFVSKARRAQAAGAKALIVCDNVPSTSGETQPMFAMSGDSINDVTIPVVFMYSQEFSKLAAILERKKQLRIRIMQMIEFKRWQLARDAVKTNATKQTEKDIPQQQQQTQSKKHIVVNNTTKSNASKYATISSAKIEQHKQEEQKKNEEVEKSINSIKTNKIATPTISNTATTKKAQATQTKKDEL